jgi:stage II sporulation protein D
MLARLAFAVLAFPLLFAGAAFATPVDDESVATTTFVLRGHGWGHGVGMGQWGAYGMAKRGVGYKKILAHYYAGTELTKGSATTVRVLLLDGKTRYTVASGVPFHLEDGDGENHDLEPGAYAVGPSLKVALGPSQQPTALTGPLTFHPGSAPLAVGGRLYRGSLQVQKVGGRIQVVNVVSIDAYVRGVVSEEVPDDWPLEAVKAQAVAARSYALSQAVQRATLYADTRSQVYGGVDAESDIGDKAVAATKHEVLKYDGKVATTFFFSSSGGRTANVTDVFASPKPIPYLVSVADPDDKVSPYHSWGPLVFTAGKMSRALNVSGMTDLRTVPASGRAKMVVATGTKGDVTIPSGTVRAALGLRSTWVRPGVLSLSRPTGTPSPGTPVPISGIAKRVKGPVSLQQRGLGGRWEAAPEISLDEDGAFDLTVAPMATTYYRLAAADGVFSTPLRVPVLTLRRIALAHVAVPGEVAAARSPAFFPDDPLASRQWHIDATRAFDFWTSLPFLDPVTVAVIDTGIDRGHPEFAGKIVAARSFVGGSADDPLGHGTFVAGLIAAAVDNAEGIAGIAFPAQLLVARVATSDGDIDANVEAKAIRWAVDQGARVINLSIGGLRDPIKPGRDTFSQAEADAVAYARSKGVVVVAAVGNGDNAPRMPWPFASYPAALPHVIGVAAMAPNGSIPAFSNQDAVFVDVAAPGAGILSTFPRRLTAERPSCVEQGYSSCGPPDFRDGNGTSFSAAIVTAEAALLLAVRPELTPDQVAELIDHSTEDVNPATGCVRCSVGRDSRSGWGSIDIAFALESAEGRLPSPDRYEANDDAGPWATRLWGNSIHIHATLDFWDDQIDVYRVYLRKGQRAIVILRGPFATQTNLILWRPGTEHIEGLSPSIQARRLAVAATPGPNERLTHRAAVTGWHFLEVKMGSGGSGRYVLRVDKTR